MGRLSGVLPTGLRTTTLLGALALLLVGSGFCACGPSAQYMYESQIRFEHCYRLDLDPSIVHSHRAACWEEWQARYKNNQTRDRLEYAKKRVDSLAAGHHTTLALDLARSGDAGVAVVPGDPAALPTSVHASPPARMPVPVSGGSATQAPPP